MHPFTDLNVGFTNAENYQRRENKALLSKYFVRDAFLDRILESNIFYLVGEKGTGKTAYATYLENNSYKNNDVTIFDVRQTEYHKFLELKKRGHLPLSQYVDVWRTLLLMMAATSVLEHSGTPDFLKRFTKLGAIKKTIDEFYQNAFSPEIVKMITFVESFDVSSKLMTKYLGLDAETSGKLAAETRDSNSVFQLHLMRIRKEFENALSATKLDRNILIFIDGIDVRPGDIAYSDYFECVRGLIEGIWALNNDFLANIKDSVGRIRVVLLVRPDTFLRTGLHNLNTKLRDNSVFLNWNTVYKDYRGSLLFKVADRLLAAQQNPPPTRVGDAWDYYFPFFAENVTARSVAGNEGVNSFLAFLRFSYHRPRDIASMLGTIQEIVKRKSGSAEYVTAEDFNDPSFRDAHAEYLLGEIRDQLLFYYSQDEFNLFLQFFPHLNGLMKFTYDQYVNAFNQFISECTDARKALPQFFESANAFLQFLYDQNVVCYKEHGVKNEKDIFIRWCFRERTLANPAPKVRIGAEYEIFYGLSKALNVGRPVRLRKSGGRRYIGTITTVEIDKGYGFIRGGPQHRDYYFKISHFQGAPIVGGKVSFEVVVKYGKLRAMAIARER